MAMDAVSQYLEEMRRIASFIESPDVNWDADVIVHKTHNGLWIDIKRAGYWYSAFVLPSELADMIRATH